MRERYEGLDSLRGLAAVTVVLSHLSLVMPNMVVERLTNTPLHIFWAGHEAVILFFVLSGFVLSLSYLNNKELPYKAFLIRRVCRIYLPYLISVLMAFIMMILVYRGSLEGLSGWFNQTWTLPISAELIINHLVLLNQFRTEEVNGAIWSLVHEMRISIIFPLLMILIMKFDWKKNLVIAASSSILYFLIYFFSLKTLTFDTTVFQGSYASSLHYISFFILGCLLAQYRHHLGNIYRKLNKATKVSILFAAILAYTYQWWFFNGAAVIHIEIIDDWVVAVGVTMFIIFTLNSETAKRILRIKTINFVGKISYSLYLYHLIVLFTMFHVFYGKLPVTVILLSVFALSLIVGGIMYYLVEKPSITIGRYLTRKKVDLKAPIGTIGEATQTAK